MEDLIGKFLLMALAVASILVTVSSWGHPKLFVKRLIGLIAGGALGMLVGGWPEGIVFGLAASAVAPYAIDKWRGNVVPEVERKEQDETHPPESVLHGEQEDL